MELTLSLMLDIRYCEDAREGRGERVFRRSDVLTICPGDEEVIEVSMQVEGKPPKDDSVEESHSATLQYLRTLITNQLDLTTSISNNLGMSTYTNILKNRGKKRKERKGRG